RAVHRQPAMDATRRPAGGAAVAEQNPGTRQPRRPYADPQRTKLSCILQEALAFAQVAPLSLRQAAQHDATHANPLEPGDLQAHLLAHATNLTLLALTQNESKLILVLPIHFGRQ